MQLFLTPTLFHESDRQPVQQLRVCRGHPDVAEVFRGFDEATPEIPLPDAIHKHARCQRMRWMRKPSGQGEAATGSRRVRPRRCHGERVSRLAQDSGNVGRHDARAVEWVAAPVEVKRQRVGADVRESECAVVLPLLRPDGVNFRRQLLQARLEFGECRAEFRVARLELLRVFLGEGLLQFGALFNGDGCQLAQLLLRLRRQTGDFPLQQRGLVLFPQFIKRLLGRFFLGVHGGIELFDLALRGGGHERQVTLVRLPPVHRGERARQHRAKAVIIPLRDGVVFVAVAAGAMECQPEHRGAEHLDLVGHDLMAVAGEIHRRIHRRVHAAAQEAGGHEVVGQLGRDDGGVAVIGQLVSGELFGEETIERLVVVQRADDVIAVAPEFLPNRIFIHGTLGIRVTGGVEPSLAPVLSVTRRGEQFVHEPFVGVRPAVEKKRRDLGGRWRKAGDGEIGAANERARRGFRGEGQPLLFELRQQEGVRGRAGRRRSRRKFAVLCRGAATSGRVRSLRRLERPPGAVGVFDLRHVVVWNHREGRGCGGSGVNPSAEKVQLALRDRLDGKIIPMLARRHDVLPDFDDDRALLRIAADQRRTGLPALKHRFHGAEVEFALLLPVAVTGQAFQFEEVENPARGPRFRNRRRGVGRGGRGVDPFLDDMKFVGIELRAFLGRHVARLDLFEERAGMGVAEADDIATFAAARNGCKGAEIKVAFGGVAAVAFEAMLLEERQDIALERDRRRGRGERRREPECKQ